MDETIVIGTQGQSHGAILSRLAHARVPVRFVDHCPDRLQQVAAGYTETRATVVADLSSTVGRGRVLDGLRQWGVQAAIVYTVVLTAEEDGLDTQMSWLSASLLGLLALLRGVAVQSTSTHPTRVALIVECDAQTRDGKNPNMTALAQGIEGFVTAFAAQYCADHGDVLRIMFRADGSEESAQDDAAWSSLVDWMLRH
jgi:putative heme iron utilization protein